MVSGDDMSHNFYQMGRDRRKKRKDFIVVVHAPLMLFDLVGKSELSVISLFKAFYFII